MHYIFFTLCLITHPVVTLIKFLIYEIYVCMSVLALIVCLSALNLKVWN